MSINILKVNPFLQMRQFALKVYDLSRPRHFVFHSSQQKRSLTKCPFSTLTSFYHRNTISLSFFLLRITAGSNIVRHLVVRQIVFDTNLAFVGLIVDAFDHVLNREEVVRRVVGVKRGWGRTNRGRWMRRPVWRRRDTTATRNYRFKGWSVGK
jgi:hypothetical protein